GAMTRSAAPAKAIEIREVMFSSLRGGPYLNVERAGMGSIINDFCRQRNSVRAFGSVGLNRVYALFAPTTCPCLVRALEVGIISAVIRGRRESGEPGMDSGLAAFGRAPE